MALDFENIKIDGAQVRNKNASDLLNKMAQFLSRSEIQTSKPALVDMYVTMDVVKLISFTSACTDSLASSTLLYHFKFYHIFIANEGGGGCNKLVLPP